MKPRKGTYYGKPLVAWAVIEDCTAYDEKGLESIEDPTQLAKLLAGRCRIQHLCDFAKSENGRVKKCGVQRAYISAVSDMIHHCFHVQIAKDEQLLFRVGMHLIPLYKTLCKLKMEELSVSNPVFLTIRGDRKADPVYREIRETIKMIMACWKDIGLQGTELGAIPVNPRGDTGYEDELFEEEPEKTKTKLNIET
jgi:hypothetical protein